MDAKTGIEYEYDSENDVLSEVLEKRKKNIQKLRHEEGEFATYYPDDIDAKEYDEYGLEMPFAKTITSQDVRNGFVHTDDICIHKLTNSKDIGSKYKKHKSYLKRLRLQTNDNIRHLAMHACPNLFESLKESHIPTYAKAPCGHITTASIVNPDGFPESMEIFKDVYGCSKESNAGYPFNAGVLDETILSAARKYANKYNKHSYLSQCNTITYHPNNEFYKVAKKLKKNECVLISQKGRDREGKIGAHVFQMCKDNNKNIVQLTYSKNKGTYRPFWAPMYGEENKCFDENYKCDSFAIMSKSNKNANVFKSMDSVSWTDRINPIKAKVLKIVDPETLPAE